MYNGNLHNPTPTRLKHKNSLHRPLRQPEPTIATSTGQQDDSSRVSSHPYDQAKVELSASELEVETPIVLAGRDSDGRVLLKSTEVLDPEGVDDVLVLEQVDLLIIPIGTSFVTSMYSARERGNLWLPSGNQLRFTDVANSRGSNALGSNRIGLPRRLFGIRDLVVAF